MEEILEFEGLFLVPLKANHDIFAGKSSGSEGFFLS